MKIFCNNFQSHFTEIFLQGSNQQWVSIGSDTGLVLNRQQDIILIINQLWPSLLMHMCPLKWCHDEWDGVSNHRRLDGLRNSFFRRRSKKTSKLRITGLCEGNSPVTSEFPSQRASDAKNVTIHHALGLDELNLVMMLEKSDNTMDDNAYICKYIYIYTSMFSS